MSIDAVNVPSNGGIESVGKGILKDSSQVRVAHSRCHFSDHTFDIGRRKGAAVGMGPLEWQSQRTFTIRLARESVSRVLIQESRNDFTACSLNIAHILDKLPRRCRD